MKILFLDGDGIDPEILTSPRAVLRTLNDKYALNLSLEDDRIGFAALKEEGTTLLERILVNARTFDAVVLGPISHMDYPSTDKG